MKSLIKPSSSLCLLAAGRAAPSGSPRRAGSAAALPGSPQTTSETNEWLAEVLITGRACKNYRGEQNGQGS